ncbi:LemA family protein [bacterium]|nr:LemA family protein [bacterium]
MWIFWVIIALVVIIVLWLIALYNRFVVLRNRIEGSWAQVDVQLKKRYDLVPNLVETVKGYAKHEREVFEKVTEARSKAISAQNVADQGEAENLLTGALKSLFAVAEAYPELKANVNFLQLQEELSAIENKIAYARQHFNDVVLAFNTQRQKFPDNIVAGMMGLVARDYFEIEEAAREAPKVSFG